jgi:hypothetical protein
MKKILAIFVPVLALCGFLYAQNAAGPVASYQGTAGQLVAYQTPINGTPVIGPASGSGAALKGVLSATLTTTAATSDNVTLAGVTTSSVCVFSAFNASAATNIATSYVSAVTANTVTITHTATASMIYKIHCTVN